MTLRNSVVALLCPVVLVGGIFSGQFTPTEAAVIACFYAIIAGVFILRTLSLKDIYESFKKAAVSSSVILLIIFMAALFGQVMALERVPTTVANLILGFTDNKFVALLFLTFIPELVLIVPRLMGFIA